MILAILVMLAVVYLAVKGFSDPFMGLLALLTVFITQPGELYPPLGYLHVERVLMLLLVIVSFFGNGQRLRFPPITKAFLCFYGAMILAIPMAFWIGNSVQFCIGFFETALIHILVVSILTTEERISKFLILWAGLTTWLGASALYMYQMGVRQFTMGIERAEGLTSAGGDPNTLAITMVISLPISFLLLSKGNPGKIRAFRTLAIAVSLITIVKTGSRTAFLAFIFFLLLLLVQQAKNLKYLPLIIIAAPLFWLVIPAQYKARYQSIETRNSDESYTNRLLSWEGGRRMFVHNPISGVGPGNYAYANGMRYWPGYPRHWLEAHSLYFKLIGELGSLGIISFGTYVFLIVKTNRSLRKKFKTQNLSMIVANFPMYCNLSIMVLLFTGYSAHNLYRNTWFILGGLTAAVSLLKDSKTLPADDTLVIDQRIPAWIPSTVPDDPHEEIPATMSAVDRARL